MRNKKLIVLLSIVSVLVILIIACCATFIVRDVEAYNEFALTPERDSEIIETSGIKRNSSIFLIDDVAVKTRIENKFYDVEVVNIERKFPDRVSINYVTYDRLFQYQSRGKYYECYASGKVYDVSDGAIGGYFTVKPHGATTDELGKYFQSTDGYDFVAVKTIVDTLHDLRLNDSMIPGYVDFIDLTREGYIYIRTKYGCSIEICGGLDDLARLFERGWNVFWGLDELKIDNKHGTIRSYSSMTNPTYAPADGNDYYIANYRSL